MEAWEEPLPNISLLGLQLPTGRSSLGSFVDAYSLTLVQILGEALQYVQFLHIYSGASVPHSVVLSHPLPVPQSRLYSHL